MNLRGALLILVLLTSPVFIPGRTLHAQRVTGTVRDSGSAIPLPGAVVVLLDTAGVTLGRTLSDGNGRFALLRSANGTRVRVIRIGFQPRVVPLPPVGAASTAILVDMTRIPPLLAPMEVSSKALCSEGPDRRRAAALWGKSVV